MKKRIYIFNSGQLKRKENTIRFINSETGQKKILPVEAVNEIAVFGDVTINKRVIEFFNRHQILMHFFNYYGYYVGSFYPREYLNSGFILLKQVEHYLDHSKRLEIAKLFVLGAFSNMKKNLSYYISHRDLDLEEELESIERLGNSINDCEKVEELRAIEGNIRKIYYKSFDKIMEEKFFKLGKREKRPPKNPLNALISFGNSLVYSQALSAIYHTNLDPRIGFLHETSTRSFSLNLDIAEIFKPVIADRVIFTLVNKKMLSASDFEDTIDYCVLKERGRKTFITEFENKLNTTLKLRKLSKRVTYRRLFQIECHKLYKHFTGEAIYKPFIGEW